MCLTINKKKTVHTLFPKGATKLVFYKIVAKKFAENILQGPFRYNYEYKPGYNYSDREFAALSPQEISDNSVSFGIHVMTSYKKARHELQDYSRNCTLIPVMCLKKDFVAAGYASDAVFLKVFIKKEDYQKALKS